MTLLGLRDFKDRQLAENQAKLDQLRGHAKGRIALQGMACEAMNDLPEADRTQIAITYLKQLAPADLERIANELGRDAHLKGRG